MRCKHNVIPASPTSPNPLFALFMTTIKYAVSLDYTMHDSSILKMQEFIKKYLNPTTPMKILEIGSFDNSMSYRKLFKNPNWTYVGADLHGKKENSVDLILPSLYHWINILDESYDVVISGQCLEHVEDMFQWIQEIKRIVKKGGLICVITVWQWSEHRFPVDCWRVLPDGMTFLLGKVAELKVLEVYKKDCDCVGIAQR